MFPPIIAGKNFQCPKQFREIDGIKTSSSRITICQGAGLGDTPRADSEEEGDDLESPTRVLCKVQQLSTRAV